MVCFLLRANYLLGLNVTTKPNSHYNETNWANGSFGKMAKTRRSISTGKTHGCYARCSLGRYGLFSGLTKMSLANQTVINETNWANGSFGKMATTRRSISAGGNRMLVMQIWFVLWAHNQNFTANSNSH